MKYNKGDEVYYWNDKTAMLIHTKVKSGISACDSYIRDIYFLEDNSVNCVVYEDELFTDKEECLNRVLHYNTATINTYKEEIRKLIKSNERIKGLFDKKSDIEKLYSVQFNYTHRDDNRIVDTIKSNNVFWTAKNLEELKRKLIKYGEDEGILILDNYSVTEY